MKSINYIFALFLMFALAACSNSGGSNNSATQGQPLPGPSVTPQPGTELPDPGATASNSNVQHYICPNNCEGSGGSVSGTCPVCGTEYTHNAAFHAQPATTPTTTITPPGNNIGNTTPLPEPNSAANANGVFHYICSAGCEGGTATKGTCPKCGGEMTHNSAYHN